MLISFIIPCYNSQSTIKLVVNEIETTMSKRKEDFEIVFVNDASKDDTFDVIREICQKNTNYKGINFAKNFGQHSALMAGFRSASGEIIVCLDDDGQTPADEVGKLLEAIYNGSDVAYAKYENKRHSLFRNFGSAVNELMAYWLLNKPKDLYVSSYFAAKRFIIDSIKEYQNPYPYVIGLILRTTNKIVNVNVKHRDRKEGKSGYTLNKLLSLWLNGFTSFSIKPLRIATITGVIFGCLGLIYFCYIVINRFLNPLVPMGYSSMMAVLLIVGGMLMVTMGLLGEYIGRMYISMNHSPQYVIRETIKLDVKDKENFNEKL